MTSIKGGRGTQKDRYEREPRSNVRELRPASAAPRVARKPDLDACPPGWDPDVWHLALYFKQVAESTTRRETLDEKIRLEHGLPLTYAYLERACEPFRAWFSRRQAGITAGEKSRSGRPLRPVYVGSSTKDVHVAENWVEVVEQAIRWHFAKYYEDEYAADTFCAPAIFRDMIRESRERAYDWNLLRMHQEER
jgi:hypothetical protein